MKSSGTTYEVDKVTNITIRPAIHAAMLNIRREATLKLKRTVTFREVVERALIYGLKRLRGDFGLGPDPLLRDVISLAETGRRKTRRYVEVEKKE